MVLYLKIPQQGYGSIVRLSEMASRLRLRMALELANGSRACLLLSSKRSGCLVHYRALQMRASFSHGDGKPACTEALVPKHRFPAASYLTQPQTASSALKSGL